MSFQSSMHFLGFYKYLEIHLKAPGALNREFCYAYTGAEAARWDLWPTGQCHRGEAVAGWSETSPAVAGLGRQDHQHTRRGQPNRTEGSAGS